MSPIDSKHFAQGLPDQLTRPHVPEQKLEGVVISISSTKTSQWPPFNEFRWVIICKESDYGSPKLAPTHMLRITEMELFQTDKLICEKCLNWARKDPNVDDGLSCEVCGPIEEAYRPFIRGRKLICYGRPRGVFVSSVKNLEFGHRAFVRAKKKFSHESINFKNGYIKLGEYVYVQYPESNWVLNNLKPVLAKQGTKLWVEIEGDATPYYRYIRGEEGQSHNELVDYAFGSYRAKVIGDNFVHIKRLELEMKEVQRLRVVYEAILKELYAKGMTIARAKEILLAHGFQRTENEIIDVLESATMKPDYDVNFIRWLQKQCGKQIVYANEMLIFLAPNKNIIVERPKYGAATYVFTNQMAPHELVEHLIALGGVGRLSHPDDTTIKQLRSMLGFTDRIIHSYGEVLSWASMLSKYIGCRAPTLEELITDEGNE